MNTIQPLDSYVLIKPEQIKNEVETKSGIIGVIITPKINYIQGEIIAIGKDVDCVKVGDIVVFQPIHAPEVDGYFIVNTSENDNRILYKKN